VLEMNKTSGLKFFGGRGGTTQCIEKNEGGPRSDCLNSQSRGARGGGEERGRGRKREGERVWVGLVF
jgi:hypothetical protein